MGRRACGRCIGMARADDSSMNPFIGDSYAYFNGGNLPKIGNPVYDQFPWNGARAIRMGYRSVNPGIVVWGASGAITGAVGNQCAALTN
jgi:hypothetical protein